jgi:hypothetical protein
MEVSNALYYSLYENSIYIYVISQDCGKFFIGKTNTPNVLIEDIKELAKKHNLRWLINYKPFRIHEIIHSLDTWDEDKITLKYMDKYGIDNVRGGSFNSIILADEELATIRNMISSAKGCCPICNSTGHIKTNCPMQSEFKDYEVIIKDKNDNVLITTPINDNSSTGTNTSTNINRMSAETIRASLSNAISSAALATNSLWNSWFGATGLASQQNQAKCLRCGFAGHKTGYCFNEIKNCEDSLMFPDNKSYNPLFKGGSL